MHVVWPEDGADDTKNDAIVKELLEFVDNDESKIRTVDSQTSGIIAWEAPLTFNQSEQLRARDGVSEPE